MGAGNSKSTQEPMTGSAVLSASAPSAASPSSSSSHPPLPLSSHLKYPAPLPAGCTILDHDKNRTPIASRPEELFGVLTAAEKQLIERCFEGLDPDNLVDIHTHIVGIGTNGSGCYINEKLNSPIGHPIIWIKKKFFLTACSVRDSDPDADLKVAEVIANLKRSTTNQLGGRHGKCHIFAFDQVYNEQGEPQKADSGFHVPNQWVFQLCQAFPDVFVPVASIHPYRKDAIDALHDAYQQGARMIKWLPNAQSINPSHPICKPFYLAMRSLGMVLLTHTGVEHSVDFAYHNDELGNPLLLRAPLDAGVKVIAAHCASEGCAGLCWHDIKQIQQLTKQEKEGEEDDHHHHEHDHDHEAGEACESKDDSIDGDDDDNGGSSSRPTKRTKLDVPPPTGTSTAPSTSIFSILFGSEPGVNLPTQPVISTLSQEEKQSASSAAIDADGNRKRKYRFERDEKEEDSEEELCGPAVHKSKVVKKVENFDLFIQLMDCKKYEGLLFGDISSVTAHKRTSVLQTLLNRQDLHHRLINGTDYPVPAVSIVIWSSQLRRMKLITPMEEKTLDKIFQYNPLLFDLLLKRCLRSREGRGFLDCVFHTPDFLKQAFETSQYSLTSNNKGVPSSASSSHE